MVVYHKKPEGEDDETGVGLEGKSHYMRRSTICVVVVTAEKRKSGPILESGGMDIVGPNPNLFYILICTIVSACFLGVQRWQYVRVVYLACFVGWKNRPFAYLHPACWFLALYFWLAVDVVCIQGEVIYYVEIARVRWTLRRSEGEPTII